MTFFLLFKYGRRHYAKDGNKNEIRRTQEFENGGSIREIWLTKWKPTKEYQVWGLHIDENGKATGWCVLFGGTLKQARNYATLWN